MAYAIKYLFKFESSNGTTREIRVLQDGYTGEVIQRPLGRAPVLKKQQNGPVHGTSLEFYAECNVDREFIEFYTSDPKAYRVDLYAGATLLWRGHITPELYSEPDIAPPYDVQVVATDGVGELKLYDYAAQGAVTLRTLLSGLLSRTGLGTDIYLISSLKPGSAGAGSLLEKTINLDYMAGNSCYEVLTYILDTLHATITWWKGAWILTRETNVTFTSGKVRYFNTAGNSALLADSVQVLGKMYANPAWPVGQLSTVIDPAKNRVTVQAPWHVVTCLRNSDMGSDSDWVKAKNARYETDGYVLPININTGTSEAAVISQATSMAGLRVPMSLSVKATGATSEISAQVTGAVLGVLLTYKVRNVTYHLVKGDDGVPVWQQGSDIGTYIPLRTRIDFQKQLATWDSSRIEAEELSIDNIPPFLQGMTFPAGTLTVYILGYCAKIYGAYLDVVLPKGYQDILRIDNGARGEGSEVEIAIGRETTDNAYYAAFLQGLLLDSGSLITSFSDANFTTGMDYLAFIARDYALSVALPRAKVTGTVFLEGSVQIPPLVFTKGGLDYWVETWGWNLYEDELEISARTLPSASLTVQSETILESNGSTVSSAGGTGSSGSGSSMGGGGGTNYWEIDGTLNTLLKPKDAYAYVSSKDGLFFTGAALSGTVVPDLYVDVVNNQRVLRSPLPLITGGDQIVIDGTPGGGGGGGGATTLAGLDDTSISNPQAGQMLAWNGTKWVNTNAPTGSITSVSLAAGASNGTLHLVVNGTAQSDVAVTGLGSLAYKSSLVASDIPDLSGTYQPKDADLTAIARLSGTSGFLKKTAANTWALDTNTYLTGITSTMVTNALGYTPANVTALGDYVKLTSAGQQIISVTGATDTPVAFKSGLENASWIGFRDSANTILGYIGMTSADGPAVYVGGAKKIWHAGNFTPSDYLPKTGGTLKNDTSTYPLTLDTDSTTEIGMRLYMGGTQKAWVGYNPTQGVYLWDGASNKYLGIKDDGTPHYNGNTLWHAGNLTLASLAGNTAKGSTSLPIYYTGSALAPITDLDLLSQSTGYVKANRVYLTSSIYFYTETVGGTVCVRLNAPFITAGDQIVISGTPGGGGGGGATSLWGLDDVSVPHGSSTPSNGQVLTWDTSLAKWTNKSITSGVSSVVGLTGDVTAAQISSAIGLSDYLPKTGGTIKNGTANGPLTLDTDGTTEIGLQLYLAGVRKAWAGYSTTYGAYLWDAASNKYLGIKDDGTPHYHGDTLLHAGNYTSYVNTTNFPGLNSTGTVTKVSTGTGLTGGDITTSGTVSINSTYQTYISNGNTAYGWGNHANAGYLLATTAASTYLPKTGGTIQYANEKLLVLNSTVANGVNNYLQFQANGTDLFEVGYYSTLGAYIQNEHGTTKHTLSLPDAGGLLYDDNTVYHSGNDGSGSGLDADLLDGQHGSYYATASAVSTLQGYFTNGAAKTARALSTLGATGYWYDTDYSLIAQWDDATHVRLKCTNAAGTVSYDVRVTAADKFVTSRTLWGQSFDGTANVTGALSSVTNIDSLLYFDTTNSRIGVGVSAPTDALHVAGKIKSITNGIGILIGDGSNSIEGINSQSYGPLYLQYYSSGNLSMCYGGGNVAIGAITPSYKLHVAGDICTNTYLRINAWSGYGSGSAAFWYNGNTSTLALDKGFSVTGTIVSTGDQVISSDLTLKTNLTPVTYSVSDIAKARAVEFDWKDGRGHSMGSIAQDWLGIAPALVHGEEGNMSLAYGQLALVNTILLARQSESHEERIARLEARVAELEMENERLRMN